MASHSLSLYIYIHTHTHIYIYIYTYIFTYVHTYFWMKNIFFHHVQCGIACFSLLSRWMPGRHRVGGHRACRTLGGDHRRYAAGATRTGVGGFIRKSMGIYQEFTVKNRDLPWKNGIEDGKLGIEDGSMRLKMEKLGFKKENMEILDGDINEDISGCDMVSVWWVHRGYHWTE